MGRAQQIVDRLHRREGRVGQLDEQRVPVAPWRRSTGRGARAPCSSWPSFDLRAMNTAAGSTKRAQIERAAAPVAHAAGDEHRVEVRRGREHARAARASAASTCADSTICACSDRPRRAPRMARRRARRCCAPCRRRAAAGRAPRSPLGRSARSGSAAPSASRAKRRAPRRSAAAVGVRAGRRRRADGRTARPASRPDAR